MVFSFFLARGNAAVYNKVAMRNCCCCWRDMRVCDWFARADQSGVAVDNGVGGGGGGGGYPILGLAGEG